MDDVDFRTVYERYAADVYRFACYLSGDAALAQDVTAETFARAWAARGRIRVDSVKAYLLMIARNVCRDAKRQPRDASLPDGHDAPDPAASPEATAQSRHELRRVLRALRQLSESDRAVLLMATVEGLSHQTIASMLGLSVTAVKVRVYRARVRLNAACGNGGNET